MTPPPLRCTPLPLERAPENRASAREFGLSPRTGRARDSTRRVWHPTRASLAAGGAYPLPSRHAKSSWADATLADTERPLAKRGRRDAKLIAKHLRGLGSDLELVLCSSAVRTRETLELVQPAVGTATVMVEERLYAASSNELLARVRLVPDSVASVMLIGHNPGLHEFALTLAGAGDELERLEAKFPTAALATLTHGKTWGRLEPGEATLAAYAVPKQLRCTRNGRLGRVGRA